MQPPDDGHDDDQARESLARVLQSLETLRIPRLELQIHDGFLLSGGFGSVRRATWLRDQGSPVSEVNGNDAYVVVKELIGVSPQSLPVRVALRFVRELRVWRTLEHPNVLRCLGFNLDIQQGDAYFVSPYISGGSIRARLSAVPTPSTDQRMQWVIDLTRGLHYLHIFKYDDKDFPVIHGGLATTNILINHKNQAMLCDFGLSSIIQEVGSTGLTTSDNFEGSIRWCSPELTYNNRRTTWSDVWAWALCVLEIMTSRMPYPRQNTVSEVTMRIAEGPPPSREEYPELQETSPIWNILELCFRREPTSRATMQDCWRQIMPRDDEDSTILSTDRSGLRRVRIQPKHGAIVDDLSGNITNIDDHIRQADHSNVPSKLPILAARPQVGAHYITGSSASLNASHFPGDRTSVNPHGRPATRTSPGMISHYSTWAPINKESGKPRLIVGMDLGMAFSGISYAYLRPSMEPKVRDVIFKGQEHELGDARVPTVLFRDEARDVWYCGVETTSLTDEDKSRLVKFEWFKSQLLPHDVNELTGTRLNGSSARTPTPLDLFTRFFKYLYGSLETYFKLSELHGRKLWQQLASEAVYVITHPNDWSGWQQDQLRRGLVGAGIVDSKGSGRVIFLSEGEASLHWWLNEEPYPFEPESQVVICNAGGGMTNVSSYNIICSAPLQLKEMKPGDTKLIGSASVTRAFRDHITGKLHGSPLGRNDKIRRMVETFEANVKPLFADPRTVQHIDFGFLDDNDEKHDIKAGTLRVSGETVGRLFESSCSDVIKAVRNHASPNCYVVFVGGFSGSPWFFHRVSTALEDITTNVKRALRPRGKAVARGAVDFALNIHAISRVARRTLGLPVDVPYDERLPNHSYWRRKVKIDPVSELQLLPGRFYPLVSKGDILSDDITKRVECIEYKASNNGAHEVVLQLIEYVGQMSDVEFTFSDEASHFVPLGDFRAKIPPTAFRHRESDSPSGAVYWEAKYNIAFIVGQTEIKCYMEWIEEGASKRILAVPHWKQR